MYSFEGRPHAIELDFKYGNKTAAVVHELGYR
jgi:hypothetical protein